MDKYNDDNMIKLAKQVVDEWEMDTLISFAEEQVFINYKNNKCDFEGDLEFYPELEETM